jgi:prefoldin subunit 5
MKILRLALDFSTDEANELTSSVARIYVAGKFSRNDDPLTYITPDCASESDLDEAIEAIHKELKILRAEGHRKFAAERLKRSTHN